MRLYELGDGLWKGDRLAVLPGARAHQLGGALVRFAVRTAGERGGARMVAQVQATNVRFFERLGWERDGEPGLYRGVMHQPMATALSAASRLRSQAVRPSSLRVRESSKLPQAARLRARGGRTPRRSRPAASVASRKPKLGNVSSQRSSGAPSGRGMLAV